MAVTVNPRVPRGETAQGFYIAGADGTGYAWTQSGNPKTTLEFLDTGLQKFREKPPKTVTIEGSEDREFAPAANTTTIRVYSWAPANPAQTKPEGPRAIGRDQLWVYADEVSQMVAALENETRPVILPPTLVARIARFHLIDTSGGHWGGRWSDTEVTKAVVDAKVKHRDGGRRTIRFEGRFAMQSADARDGFDGSLDGEFDIDISASKLVRFQAYGQGHGWGEHGWPRVFPPTPEYPCEARPRFALVFAMLQTNDEVARTVPPVALIHGAPYANPTISANPR